jgi:uncharacterized protein YbjQ (UPF0145 family)
MPKEYPEEEIHPEEDTSNFLCVTTSTLPGYKITETIGLVSGQMVTSKHVFSDIFANIKGLFGGEIKGYTVML